MSTRKAFDRGARHYDLLVTLNPGYHQHLRAAAAELIERVGRDRPRRLLDLACGTGASTRALLQAVPEGSRIEGVDQSAGMLARARTKPWPSTVTFHEGALGALDPGAVETGARDGALAAYLYRNVPEAQRDSALRETYELLAPGGWLVVQEYSVAQAGSPTPWHPARRWSLVCWLIIIPLGLLVGRDTVLYRYLWRSVLAFDSPERFRERLAEAGFTDVSTRSVPGWQRGILHTFRARRPEGST